MVAGAAIILFITLKHNFLQTNNLAPQEINIHAIGHALLDVYKRQCAGSTTGGIKCIRMVILFKVAKNEFKHILHPLSLIHI